MGDSKIDLILGSVCCVNLSTGFINFKGCFLVCFEKERAQEVTIWNRCIIRSQMKALMRKLAPVLPVFKLVSFDVCFD